MLNVNIGSGRDEEISGVVLYAPDIGLGDRSQWIGQKYAPLAIGDGERGCPAGPAVVSAAICWAGTVAALVSRRVDALLWIAGVGFAAVHQADGSDVASAFRR